MYYSESNILTKKNIIDNEVKDRRSFSYHGMYGSGFWKIHVELRTASWKFYWIQWFSTGTNLSDFFY